MIGLVQTELLIQQNKVAMDTIEVIQALTQVPTPEGLTIVEFRVEYLENVDGPICRVLSTLGLERVNLTPIEFFVFNEIEELFTTEECFQCQLLLGEALEPFGLRAALEVVEIEDYSPRWIEHPDIWVRVI